MLIVKTEVGQQVLKDRSVPLTPRQRSAFIMVDGKKTLDQVLAATGPSGVTRADIDRLLELGLVAQVAKPSAAAAAAAGAAASGKASLTPQERYAAAYPVAIQLTSGLGLRGFRLNLAVEAATSFEQLMAVAPKIREAVGPERYRPLEKALGER
ncbi:hypothetical protein [Ramlibacter sp.]|uniref:hypothetical protein n=1 Tax=Ramlibacter sp. TaxID=1917967 RepID=UPI002B89AF6B|nr:hypothetical protein [Ramlibacter sp.]HWI80643.1 hypothetical protein [Ramlibacter sp.]